MQVGPGGGLAHVVHKMATLAGLVQYLLQVVKELELLLHTSKGRRRGGILHAFAQRLGPYLRTLAQPLGRSTVDPAPLLPTRHLLPEVAQAEYLPLDLVGLFGAERRRSQAEIDFQFLAASQVVLPKPLMGVGSDFTPGRQLAQQIRDVAQFLYPVGDAAELAFSTSAVGTKAFPVTTRTTHGTLLVRSTYLPGRGRTRQTCSLRSIPHLRIDGWSISRRVGRGFPTPGVDHPITKRLSKPTAILSRSVTRVSAILLPAVHS